MKLHGIQTLRALAALLVLVYHIGNHEALRNGSPSAPVFTSSLFDNGYLGVDLFFVISGFIMMYVTVNLSSGLGTVRNFLLGRLFRIYPVYWLFAGVLALYLFIATGTAYNPATLKSGEPGGWIYVLKSFLLIPQVSQPLLVVGWTLVHEMYFYMVFCVLLFLPGRLRLIALAIWAGLIVAAYYLHPPFFRNTFILKFMLSPYSLEFIAGTFAGWLFQRTTFRMALPLSIIGLVAFLALMLITEDKLSSWSRATIFSLPAAILVFGAAGLPASWTSFRPYKWISTTGDWSYSLYLSHSLTIITIPLGSLILARIGAAIGMPASSLTFLHMGSPGMMDNVWYVTMCFIAAFVVAALSYYFYERPILHVLKRRFK